MSLLFERKNPKRPLLLPRDPPPSVGEQDRRHAQRDQWEGGAEAVDPLHGGGQGFGRSRVGEAGDGGDEAGEGGAEGGAHGADGLDRRGGAATFVWGGGGQGLLDQRVGDETDAGAKNGDGQRDDDDRPGGNREGDGGEAGGHHR